VNRGRPSNYLLPTVENRDKDLKVMNEGKVGRPDKKTRKILNIIITDSGTGDAKEFIPLLKPIEYVKIAAGAGAYDSEDNFKHCDEKGITLLVPVRINKMSWKNHAIYE